jgi:hypothetical protein
MVIKIAVKISFFSPGRATALLKKIMIKGVQMTERRMVRRLWTDRRYPPSIKIKPERSDPVGLTLKSLSRK